MTQPGSTMANSSFSSSLSAVLTEKSYDPYHLSKLIKPSGTLSGPVPVSLHDRDGFCCCACSNMHAGGDTLFFLFHPTGLLLSTLWSQVF